MEFTRRPDRVHAERWDGTSEGAAKIVQLLTDRWGRARAQVITEFEGDKNEPYSFILIAGFGHARDDIRLRPDHWLILDGSGLQTLDDDAMQYLYKKVK